MTAKTDYIQIRITDEEKAEITELVDRLNDPEMSVSRFVRDAVREKAARTKRVIQRRQQSDMAVAAR